MMFQVLGSFAEYERDMIRAGVNAGDCAGQGSGQTLWSAAPGI